jgi:glycosyltransferase involved in cell wall biosynthesis
MMRILYLYAEVMGYTMATIKALVERGAEVHVVHWDHKKLTPYQPPKLPSVHLYKRSAMSVEDIARLAQELSPAVTVVSGWQDKGYMAVARRLRSQGSILVTGFDDQWHGTLQQYVAAALGFFGYFSRHYSHAWVSGVCQYEYARRLGFDKGHIVYDLYCADQSLFLKAFQSSLETKQKNYPHRFLFVGRFEAIKGLNTLLSAWLSLDQRRHDWELHLIGNGSLETTLRAVSGVIVKDFMQPDKLVNEIAETGCFILPSRGEPWGVVVHEFAAAGMPLILSDAVGAASTFLVPGLNGYSFRANDAAALAEKMEQIIDSSDDELLAMSVASHRLSERITPHTSAANLLSILDRK